MGKKIITKNTIDFLKNKKINGFTYNELMKIKNENREHDYGAYDFNRGLSVMCNSIIKEMSKKIFIKRISSDYCWRCKDYLGWDNKQDGKGIDFKKKYCKHCGTLNYVSMSWGCSFKDIINNLNDI